MKTKQTTLSKLTQGDWFRFPNDKERWVVGRATSEDEEGNVDKIQCFSLQTGYDRFYPAKTIVHRIKKT